VPRSSGRLVTALSFTSTKWPRSVAPGEVVIRASAGRDGDGRALALDDAALLGAIRRELSELLGIAAEPLDHVVQCWPASFPQYVSGHLQRVGRIRQLAAALPGFALAGAAYDGIGIPACVASGERAASVIDEHLSR
jgi:oxygen-dependent protoporphyrinogen oxidase